LCDTRVSTLIINFGKTWEHGAGSRGGEQKLLRRRPGQSSDFRAKIAKPSAKPIELNRDIYPVPTVRRLRPISPAAQKFHLFIFCSASGRSRVAMRSSMFQVLGLLLQIKFAMTQSQKWARDRAKLIDPLVRPRARYFRQRLYFAVSFRKLFRGRYK
jgi:hypothetical protein